MRNKQPRERETLVGCILYAPQGTEPSAQACCPHWESKLQLFDLLDDAQPTEPHQLGFINLFFKKLFDLETLFLQG